MLFYKNMVYLKLLWFTKVNIWRTYREHHGTGKNKIDRYKVHLVYTEIEKLNNRKTRLTFLKVFHFRKKNLF